MRAVCYVGSSGAPALSQQGRPVPLAEGVRAESFLCTSISSQLPSTQTDPSVKVAYFGVAFCGFL